MQDCDDCKRVFIGGVSNHIVADNLKSERTRCEVWATVPEMGKEYQRLDCVVNLLEYAVGASRLSAAICSQISSRSE